MKKLDLYISKKFLVSFVLSIVLLLLIIIAFDVSEKIDRFLDKKAPLNAIIFQYYLNFIPYFVNLFSALFVFISVIFFTSRMAAQSEINAILTSGISFKRLLRPYIVTSFILGLFSFVLQNYIIPPANKERLEFEQRYLRKNPKLRERMIHLQLSPGTYIFFESYNIRENSGDLFTLETMDFESGLHRKLHAEKAIFDTITQCWHLVNTYERSIRDTLEKLSFRAKIDTCLPITPTDLNYEKSNIETMNLPQLNRYIDKQIERGADNVIDLQVEKHKRFASGFSAIILTIIGVALSSRKVRGGTGLNLGIGVTLSFGYILLMQFSSSFAVSGDMPPMLAVWTPNLLFAALAWYLVKKAPK